MDSKIILGIDEVGRGPWAGPLVVGAAILGQENQEWYQRLNDSKKLTSKRRSELNQIILENAVTTGLGWVSAEELDKFGISASLRLATRRAVKPILAQKVTFDEIIIDGTVNFLLDTPLENYVSTLKKADSLEKSVSAASIIAKVARDNYMIQLGQQYPKYGFEKHMGYGTATHSEALQKYGICPEHRRSFRPIKELIAKDNDEFTDVAIPEHSSTTDLGQEAEQSMATYLEKCDHCILARNVRTRFYEIDIISLNQDKIYFTEVKYSQFAKVEGTALKRINHQKVRQLKLAAEDFLRTHPQYQKLQPVLAVGSVSGADFVIDQWFELSWDA